MDGYEYTHEGSFASGHIIKGNKTDITECADECDKDDQCIAFSHQSIHDKTCVIYHYLDERMYEWEDELGKSRAYIRCSSMYILYTLHCYLAKLHKSLSAIFIILLTIKYILLNVW